ncbi:hypothetical protein RI367_008279 [Sorochytrium milnesiophthora]
MVLRFPDGSFIVLPESALAGTAVEEQNIRFVHQYVRQLLDFISTYRHLYDFHAVDFFVEQYMDTLPGDWAAFARQGAGDQHDVDTFLDWMVTFAGESDVQGTCRSLNVAVPDTLREYLEKAHTIGLPRDPQVCSQEVQVPKAALDTKVVLGMTPKKVHEVELLAGYIAQMCTTRGINRLVDIGAGQGYLSSVLALKYGLHVIGVDYDTVQTNGANRRRELIMKRYSKRAETRAAMGKLVYLNKTVTSADTFDGLVSESNASGVVLVDSSTNTKDGAGEQWGIVGLHTCGDLSPHMMHMFCESESSVIVNLGCCYHHLSEEFEQDTDVARTGFPMSQILRDADTQLGWTARMLACQSTCRWPSQDRAKEAFVRHFHRALLQRVLFDATGSSPTHVQIHSPKLRRGPLGTFKEYFGHAMERLQSEEPGMYTQILDLASQTTDTPCSSSSSDPQTLLDKLADAYWSRYYPAGLREVALVWTLRAMVAEAIESLILVDRWLWLYEHPQPVIAQLFPLFGHIDSPRNMCLVGLKSPQ